MRQACSWASVLLIALAAFPVQASKSCASQSWFANPNRSAAQWFAQAERVVIAKLEAVQEIRVPYPTCRMRDPSRCATFDRSVVRVAVLRWEKNPVKKTQVLVLAPGRCTQDPPKEIGKTYRFYIHGDDGKGTASYSYYAPLQEQP